MTAAGEPVMTTALERRCVDLLCKLGLASEGDPVEVVPLGGGVASDIARVRCWRPGLLREVRARKAEGCGGMARAGAPEPGGIRLARVRGLS